MVVLERVTRKIANALSLECFTFGSFVSRKTVSINFPVDVIVQVIFGYGHD